MYHPSSPPQWGQIFSAFCWGCCFFSTVQQLSKPDRRTSFVVRGWQRITRIWLIDGRSHPLWVGGSRRQARNVLASFLSCALLFSAFCLAVPGLAALGETGLSSLFPFCRRSLFACAFFVALFFLEEWPMVRPVFPYVLRRPCCSPSERI